MREIVIVLAVLLTLVLAAPALAQVGWQSPKGVCEYPTGEIVTEPVLPKACGPYELCILWGPGNECVETEPWQPAQCAFTWAEYGSPAHQAAVAEFWSELWGSWLPCVMWDYALYIYAIGK